jgi:hypothetical protein
MTQEEAKQKVKIEKSDIYPYSIYDNVDEIIDEIYDDFEKELKQGQDNYNKLWDMYSELKKELGNRTCESCKHFKLDYFEPNRGTCRNKNVPTTGYMVDCDYGCNRYEAKGNK